MINDENTVDDYNKGEDKIKRFKTLESSFKNENYEEDYENYENFENDGIFYYLEENYDDLYNELIDHFDNVIKKYKNFIYPSVYNIYLVICI